MTGQWVSLNSVCTETWSVSHPFHPGLSAFFYFILFSPNLNCESGQPHFNLHWTHVGMDWAIWSASFLIWTVRIFLKSSFPHLHLELSCVCIFFLFWAVRVVSLILICTDHTLIWQSAPFQPGLTTFQFELSASGPRLTDGQPPFFFFDVEWSLTAFFFGLSALRASFKFGLIPSQSELGGEWSASVWYDLGVTQIMFSLSILFFLSCRTCIDHPPLDCHVRYEHPTRDPHMKTRHLMYILSVVSEVNDQSNSKR